MDCIILTYLFCFKPLWAEASSSTTHLNDDTQSQVPAPPQAPAQAPTPRMATGASHSVFSINYYAQYFDIDTIHVMRRCLIALNPFTSAKFFASFAEGDEITGNMNGTGSAMFEMPPDLYGPFWISTTVVFAVFLSSSITGVFLAAYKGKHYEYDFDLLNAAAFIMFIYTFVWPPVLWVITSYVLKMNPTNATIFQFLCLFGYSNVIWIPVAILSVNPVAGVFPQVADWLRLSMVILGYLFSVTFLAKNLKPVFVPRETANIVVNKKKGYFLLVLVCLAHGGLAISVFCFIGNVRPLL